MDQEFWVKGLNGQIELTVTKMKDAELPPPQRFRIKQIDLDVQDEEGQPITGAYIKREGDPLDFEVAKTKSGRVVIAREIVQLIYTKWPGRTEIIEALQIGDATLDRIYKRMAQEGLVERGSNLKAGWKLSDKARGQFEISGGALLESYKQRVQSAEDGYHNGEEK